MEPKQKYAILKYKKYNMFTDDCILKDYAEGERYKISLVNERTQYHLGYGIGYRTIYDVKLDIHFPSKPSAASVFEKMCDATKVATFTKINIFNYDGFRVPGWIMDIAYDNSLNISIKIDVKNSGIYSTIKKNRPFDVTFAEFEKIKKFYNESLLGTIQFR